MAAQVIWRGGSPAALLLIEDSLVPLRAGASDSVVGSTLMLAGRIRARTGDLSGALAAHFPASISPGTNTSGGRSASSRLSPWTRLGEAAYDAAAGRGAAMDEDEDVRYALGELRRVAPLLATTWRAGTVQTGGPGVRTVRERPRVHPARHVADQTAAHVVAPCRLTGLCA